MLVGVPLNPQRGAKTARVLQSQAVAIGQHHVQMVVLAGWGLGRHDAQIAGHPQVQHQGVFATAQQQVFGASFDLMDDLSGELLRQ